MVLSFPEKVFLQSLIKYNGKISYAEKDILIPKETGQRLIFSLQEKNILGSITGSGDIIKILPLPPGAWEDLNQPNSFIYHQVFDDEFFKKSSLDVLSLTEEEKAEFDFLVLELKKFITKIKAKGSLRPAILYEKNLAIVGLVPWKKVLEKTWGLLKMN